MGGSAATPTLRVNGPVKGTRSGPLRAPRGRPPARALLATTLLLSALAGPSPARAEAETEPTPASGGALRVTADPPRLVLGRDGTAELRIAAPAEVEDLTVTVSVGRVENVRRVPGGFAARYRPPAERYPQVALVAAVGRWPRGACDGWLAIPLAGQGGARVRGEPGQEVSLRIGNRIFPGQVGQDGVALIPVVVPPGVREGHHNFTPVDLDVPDTLLVHGALDRPTVRVDRKEQLRFFVYVVAPHGAARRSDVPVVEASRGVVAITPREAGAFEGTWALPPGTAGEERLTLRAPGGSAARAVVRLVTLAGPPATVAVSFDRSALVAGEGDEIQVTARALDAAGNPAPAALVMASELGTFGPAEDLGPGAVASRLKVPAGFGGRRELIVSARAPSSGISGARTLTLVPAPAATVTLSPDRGVYRADGRTEVELALAVRDRFGNPVWGVPRVSSGHGQITRLAPSAPGDWRVSYRPEPVRGRVSDVVAAELGPVRGEADVLLVPPLRPGGLLVSAGALGFGNGSAGGLSLGAGVELPVPEAWTLPPSLRAGWRLDALGLAGGGGDRGLGILAGAVVRGEVRHGPEWFASATAGAWLGVAGRSGRAGAAPALRLAMGAALPVRNGAPFVEVGLLGAGRTPLDGTAAVQLSVGYRWDLPGAGHRTTAFLGEE
jgi:hypothetical protein